MVRQRVQPDAQTQMVTSGRAARCLFEGLGRTLRLSQGFGERFGRLFCCWSQLWFGRRRSRGGGLGLAPGAGAAAPRLARAFGLGRLLAAGNFAVQEAVSQISRLGFGGRGKDAE